MLMAFRIALHRYHLASLPEVWSAMTAGDVAEACAMLDLMERQAKREER